MSMLVTKAPGAEVPLKSREAGCKKGAPDLLFILAWNLASVTQGWGG